MSASNYRQRALKILPWVCARCGRDFTGKNLRQLTVHHKDHDHRNNPPDGSNWELLCIYCHDDEHSRNELAGHYGKPTTGRKTERSTYKPFEALGDLLKKPDDAIPDDAKPDDAKPDGGMPDD